MSASLVRKGLQIVDPQNSNKHANKRKKTDVFQLAPENQKVFAKGYKRKGKEVKVNLLSSQRKLTVAEIRKKKKSKEQILQENLKKLQLIKKAGRVELDEKILKQIIERAVTKRPVSKPVNKKDQKTAFTEEDFKKFEEEYFGE